MSSQPTPLTVIIRHTGGSKKGQTEKFSVGNDLSIRIGRGPDNNVSFDPVKEDTISREHCIIRLENFTTDTFQIIDSQSRNGTFVNGKRITEKTTIFAGDMISLGKDGPSMEFDVDPRPASHVKKNRGRMLSSFLFSLNSVAYDKFFTSVSVFVKSFSAFYTEISRRNHVTQ